MDYRLPVELTTPEGGVLVTNRSVDMSTKAKGRAVSRDIEKAKKLHRGKRVDVIVVAHDEPWAVHDCVMAVRRCTDDWIDYRVVAVDNGCGDYTREMLAKMHDEQVVDELIQMDDHVGYLPAMHVATQETSGDWIVYLSPRVTVTEGWLGRMLGSTDDPKIAMVVPWSNKRIPPPAGSNYVDVAERLRKSATSLRHEVALPGGWCLLVNRRELEAAGGLDVDRYTPGYGEIPDLYMRLFSDRNRIAVRADDCYVLDKTPGFSEAEEWLPRKRAGYIRFMRRWGRRAEKAYATRAGKDRADESAKGVLSTPSDMPEAVFLFRGAPVCGLVLAAVHLSNALARRGWRASFACTKLEQQHWRHMPASFTPYVFSTEKALVSGLCRHLGKGATVISTTWTTAEDAAAIAEKRPDVRCIYYVQDDERLFRYPSGELYSDPKRVEASYGLGGRLVANSQWVADFLTKLGHDPLLIPIGVNTRMFRPEAKVPERPRIMAHCRPSTPRRGWEFVRDVFNTVGGGADAEFVVYDEEPEGLMVRYAGNLGRVSPEELSRHMSRAHIFLEGSERQGFGMPALEAMSCGCAVVAADNYGIHTYGTSGKDCVVVPHGDVKRAAAVILRLLEHDEERRQLAENARKTALGYDWHDIAGRWDRLLRI
jgi:glycosyltransferase involved in cell wall biosynthesis